MKNVKKFNRLQTFRFMPSFLATFSRFVRVGTLTTYRATDDHMSITVANAHLHLQRPRGNGGQNIPIAHRQRGRRGSGAAVGQGIHAAGI